MTVPKTVEEIEAIVRKLDPKLKASEEAFKAAVVMLSALEVGANERAVVAHTAYPKKLVAKFAANLKRSRVWNGGKTSCEWFDKTSGGAAFWCDVAVALGYISRVKS